jgi:hypothetical protein
MPPPPTGDASFRAVPPPPGEVPGTPEPGQLNIREKRSFRTWQLVTAVGGAIVFGMFLGNVFAGGSTSASPKAGSTGGYKLPPAAAPAGGTSTPGGAGSSATTVPPTATTLAGSSSTTTTAAGGAPPTSAPAGTVSVLLGPKQSSGAWTSTPFTVSSGQWNIGWAYRCTPAPASGPAFQVFVVPAGGSPGATPAVNETAGAGQSVTPQTSTGSQELMVQAPSTCIWIVKVTGVG